MSEELINHYNAYQEKINIFTEHKS